MARQLTWKYFSKEDLGHLQSTTEMESLQTSLASIIQWPYSSSEKAVVSQLCYALAFCREQRFSLAQTSAALGIIYVTISADANDWSTTSEQSVSYFKELLLEHAVERPPISVGLFSETEVKSFFDYVLRAYYLHFRLYKFCTAAVPQLSMKQSQINGILTPSPKLFTPLSSAILVEDEET